MSPEAFEADAELRNRAARVGPRVSLMNVRLWALNADQHSDLVQVAPGALIDAHTEIESGYRLDQNELTVHVEYKLNASLSDDGLWEMAFMWVLSYQLAGNVEELDDGDFSAFAAVSGVFAAHPYARALVQNLTSTMGLPPLVLDVMRSPLDASPVGIAAASDR